MRRPASFIGHPTFAHEKRHLPGFSREIGCRRSESATSRGTGEHSSTELRGKNRKGSGDGFRSRPIVAAGFVAERERSRDLTGVVQGRRTPARHGGFHFGCALARVLPSEAVSRCTSAGVLPRTSRSAYTRVSMRRRSAGAHPKWKKNDRGPDPGRSPGLWNSERGGRVSRTRRPPGWGQPRTRDARTPAPAGRRARTHGGRRGLGRCERRSGCSRACPGSVPFEARGVSRNASCK